MEDASQVRPLLLKVRALGVKVHVTLNGYFPLRVCSYIYDIFM